MKKYLPWFFLVASCSLVFSQEIITKVLNPPNRLRCNEAAPKLNQILFGAVPPNSDDKPVVVFVHGWFDNGYAWFMTGNDWYKRCYESGYKTAFFFQSPNGTFQDNGQMVADMIRQTCSHYNSNTVIALCHSKGGFDTEWALYNSGMWDTVQGVITLSTPFWGAPMADLIANPGIRSALGMVPIVGPMFQGDGTYQMQPAYMAGVVRPMLDNHPHNRPEKFHCFASWGYDHVLRIPNQVNLDALMVVFPDARPACGIVPGFNVIAGNLMSGFMNITGQLSRWVGVQDAYENPAGDNAGYVDGLAPYYSSVRPGAFNFSEPPPSTQSKLNHLDVLYAFEMWDRVKPQIEYCWQNPVLRVKKANEFPPQDVVANNEPVSNFQFIQSASVTFTKGENAAQMILIGSHNGSTIKIYEGNTWIKTVPLNYELEGMFDLFHAVDLSELAAHQIYTVVFDKEITALLDDGNAAVLKIETNGSGAFYSGEITEIKAIVENSYEYVQDIQVTGFLNRNMDENGKVITGLNIPVSFEYDASENKFVCRELPVLPKGIYNLSVFANGVSTHRFATTSIALLNDRRNFTDPAAIKIFPNPASSQISVSYHLLQQERMQLNIYDLSGKLVMQKDLSEQFTGNNTIQLSLNGLSKGTYILQLTGKSFSSQQKLSVF